MSSSVERVGGVEPETVALYRWTTRTGRYTAWYDQPTPPPSVAKGVFSEAHEFVPLSALRSVEKELRQAREERDAMREMYARSVAARVDYLAARDAAEADRDRLAEALRKVSSAHHANMRTHCRKCAGAGILTRAALAELAAVQGEHEQDGEDAGVVGDSALPGESVRGAIDPALIRASATDAVAKRDAIRRRLARLDNGEYSVLEMVDDLESLLRHPLWEQCHQAAQDVERLSDEIAAVRNDDSEATR